VNNKKEEIEMVKKDRRSRLTSFFSSPKTAIAFFSGKRSPSNLEIVSQ
jgi:hypothetical protein